MPEYRTAQRRAYAAYEAALIESAKELHAELGRIDEAFFEEKPEMERAEPFGDTMFNVGSRELRATGGDGGYKP